MTTLFLGALAAVYAWTRPGPAPLLPAAGEEQEIRAANVRSHVEFLAHDALLGRKSGSRDEAIAAAYVGATLRRWGVEPAGDPGRGGRTFLQV